MKKIILSIIVSLLFLLDLNAQKHNFSKDVPDYLLAENSDFVVFIITMQDFGTKRYIRQSEIPEAYNLEYTKTDAQDPGQEFFDAVNELPRRKRTGYQKLF